MNQSAAQQRFQGPVGEAIQPAGFIRRFAAVMIDGLICAVVSMPVSFLFQYLEKNAPEGQAALLAVFNLFLSLVLAGTYAGYFYSRKGATPGKAALGLQVVQSESGAFPSFKSAFYRDTIGKTVSTLVFGIGYFMAAFRGDKRALHDLMSHTQVVKRK